MAELPSQDYLKSRIDYNPETGEARWKTVDSSFGVNWQNFNSRFAGKTLSEIVQLDKNKYSVYKLLYKMHTGQDVTKVLKKKPNSREFDNFIPVLDDIPLNNKVKVIPPDIATKLTLDHIQGQLYRKEVKIGFPVRGYSYIKYDNTKYAAHRVIWRMYYDSDPGDYQIDHIDGSRSNNSIKNLRLATYSFNQQAWVKDGKGYKIRSNGTFNARITVNKNWVDLGTYKTPEEAKAAYDEALAKYKPIYQFTPEEQAELDELYTNYPNVTRELQHRCHALQVKALNHYIEGATQ